MISSGLIAKATNGDGPALLLPVAAPFSIYRSVTIINGGAAAGFFSLDGGGTWCRLMPTSIVTLDNVSCFQSGVQVMREAGGTDMDGLYAYAY